MHILFWDEKIHFIYYFEEDLIQLDRRGLIRRTQKMAENHKTALLLGLDEDDHGNLVSCQASYQDSDCVSRDVSVAMGHFRYLNRDLNFKRNYFRYYFKQCSSPYKVNIKVKQIKKSNLGSGWFAFSEFGIIGSVCVVAIFLITH